MSDTEEIVLDVCAECDESIEPDDVRAIDGDTWHHHCRTRCEICERGFHPDDIHSIRYTEVCENCSSACWECNDRHFNDEMQDVNGHMFCENCVRYCDSCCTYVQTDYIQYSERRDCYICDDCGGAGGDGIREYGHTYPEMWLGGPLPRDEKDKIVGYYIGFELEISADRNVSATAVHDWAEEHMAHGALDCKEDSSVRGFEIATHPMTPAFFESVNWESFFDMLNDEYPIYGEEPSDHGLHVHLGRVAFGRDDVLTACYSYLLSQSDHLDRIARREPTGYCRKVHKPVSATIVQHKPYSKQGVRLRYDGIYANRDAINLQNDQTIEVRAFKSTRSADELRDAVRVTYLAADYIVSLRPTGHQFISPKALHWSEFAKWVGKHHPEAYRSVVGRRSHNNAKAKTIPPKADPRINTVPWIDSTQPITPF